jgi:hypothetical protein
MNLLNEQAVSLRGDSGAGDGLGTVAHAGPAHPLTVGAVGFGPCWQDDEPSLRAMYDRACQTIVRLECEAEETKAQLATYEVERGILEKELRRLREEVAKYRASRLTDEDDYVQLTDKGRALLEGMR